MGTKKYTYDYPRPAAASDSLIFGFDIENKKLSVLLIQRLNEPFRDMWALPGGFIDLNESAEKCVVRELEEETGLKNIEMEQFVTRSAFGRDPRGHVISVFFWAVTNISNDIKAADDAKSVCWFPIDKLPEMAFDHSEIIELAIKKLKFRINLYEHYSAFFGNITQENIYLIKKIIENDI